MHKIVTFLMVLFVFFIGFSQTIQLSDKAQVSIITVGQGTNLYDSFGHSAIRVKDLTNRIDVVYNYGTYDFNTPNFYTKFAQGKLLYDLRREPFYYFFKTYKKENRSLTEQILDLSTLEKQHYFNYLENNLKPENRKYLYDFFYDNCATRLRKVTNEVLGKNNIDYKDELLDKGYTFRELIHKKLTIQDWGKFGIDLALGSVIDKKAPVKDYSFLPEYIQKSFENAERKKIEIPLVKKTTILYKKQPVTIKKTTYTPMLIFTTLFFLVLLTTIKDYKTKTISKKIDFFILFITGLLGLIVLLLWFATDHLATKENWNILWAFFPNIFMAFIIYKNRKLAKKYYKFLLILLLLMAILWLFKIQVFNLAVIPILLLLVIRYLYNINYKS